MDKFLGKNQIPKTFSRRNGKSEQAYDKQRDGISNQKTSHKGKPNPNWLNQLDQLVNSTKCLKKNYYQPHTDTQHTCEYYEASITPIPKPDKNIARQ